MVKNIELIQLNDGEWIISGEHLSLEEAKERFDEEIISYTDYPIIDIRHSWLRYEFVHPDDFDLDYDDDKYALWVLHKGKRPKGVVRKCTEII
jgi:hypothetical protein